MPRKILGRCSALIGLALAVGAFGSVAQAKVDFSPDFTYQIPVKESCKKQEKACGVMVIWREASSPSDRVELSLEQEDCLPRSVDYIHSRSIFMSGRVFAYRIDQPQFKLKIRGRFFDRSNGKSFVRGSYSFRNLQRKCGAAETHFLHRMWTPPKEGH